MPPAKVEGDPDQETVPVYPVPAVVVVTGVAPVTGAVTPEIAATLITPVMANVRITSAAASKFAFPAWLAVMEHVPGVTAVMTKPATVQILKDVDVKVTVRDDEALGATV